MGGGCTAPHSPDATQLPRSRLHPRQELHRPVTHPITKFQARISEPCRQYRVGRLDLFGSTLHAEFEERGSDIDLLVEFIDT